VAAAAATAGAGPLEQTQQCLDVLRELESVQEFGAGIAAMSMSEGLRSAIEELDEAGERAAVA
jgi:DNA-binding FrmR family transcriptional regulator